jgi:phospholipid transport system substrate-binding protein
MLASLSLAVVLSASSPLQVVKAGNDQVQKVLSSPDASVDKLAVKADEFIDFVELAKRALGAEWGKLSKKQQDEFAATMKGLLRASYAQKAISDGKNGSQMEWGAEKVTGNEASVASTLVVKKDKFPVEYRLYRPDAKSGWRIYDVVTDDVSLVSTYADQFRQLISKKGYDGLLSTLKARKEQLEQSPEQHAEVPKP